MSEPTHGDNNDFLLGAQDESKFTARDILTYLYAESKWDEDVDGDADDEGRSFTIVNHDIRIRDSLLDELIDMAGIKRRGMESPLEALARANEEDCAVEIAKRQTK
ncbi:MAG: hypothetical protein K2Y42_06795 [Hyphomicrobium sp.]|jgi:hypothetical protein|uniref:hypothetical protein n=1 Tax=Hyphomicrobium sp. TaxID=82 RepID=UPI0025BF4900|nr:hypothetical protein [Hyphomicrobium sp.]MBX9862445.1 hypothetical protein [Hyphomicrobium sp.]